MAEMRVEVEGVRKAIGQMEVLMSKLTDNEIRKALKPATVPLIRTAQAFAPESNYKHYRVNKGSKEKIYYNPGNLKRSYRILTGRRLKKGGFLTVGPQLDKTRQKDSGKGKGPYISNSSVDGYYAHFVEYGAPNVSAQRPFGRAYESTKSLSLKMAERGLLELFNKEKKKIATR